MGRASIGYINKDYESIRQELLAKIPQLTDRWTDFNHSDLGVVLLDLFCGVGDMLAYYLDAQAAEAFLPTARQRQNVINLCKLIGYRLDSPVASTTTLRFRLSAPLGKDLTIPAGTACRALLSDGEADFETVEDGLIPRGVLSVDIPARQGVRRTETFTSTGLPFQRIRLTGDVIAQGTITVTVGDDAWSEVDHFQDSLADSRHFMADLDALDISTLIFGDGQSGAVPTQGSAITVSYLQTIGDQGNLGPNRITQLLSPVYPPPAALRGKPSNTPADRHRRSCAVSGRPSPWRITRRSPKVTPASPRPRCSTPMPVRTSAITTSNWPSPPMAAACPRRCSSGTSRSFSNAASSSLSRSTCSIRSTAPFLSTPRSTSGPVNRWKTCAAASKPRSPISFPSTKSLSARPFTSPTWWP